MQLTSTVILTSDLQRMYERVDAEYADSEPAQDVPRYIARARAKQASSAAPSGS